ncbi:hypothetical protein FA13DRAFT_1738355 [Coprinellus micaceus]|uniref:Uncharacterized protein n=1 Tax=Coprinellus micaceus TaxID=71717 RepID=A0A4Y7SW20_COPMI|nr:hypothetical protein FA13DRAFT_1738355 [Coprinellus micaceus]
MARVYFVILNYHPPRRPLPRRSLLVPYFLGFLPPGSFLTSLGARLMPPTPPVRL